MVAGDLRGHLPGWPPGDGGCEHALCPGTVEPSQGPSLRHLCRAGTRRTSAGAKASAIWNRERQTHDGRGGTDLKGRGAESEQLDRLVEDVRSGESRALVVHGEAGIGKTALLAYVTEHGLDCGFARAGGVQSEMELPFAALHQLCGPMLDHLDRLPGPQREALATVFGLAAGSAPDRFVVGLATLGLLSEVAEKQPLVCLIDDHQWLDQASRQVLAFVARRLGAESLGLVFAARVLDDDLAGLPQLLVTGLEGPDARALLDSVLTGSLDARVRDQIVTETRGNPLALLELPRGRTADELAGGFAIPHGRR